MANLVCSWPGESITRPRRSIYEYRRQAQAELPGIAITEPWTIDTAPPSPRGVRHRHARRQLANQPRKLTPDATFAGKRCCGR